MITTANKDFFTVMNERTSTRAYNSEKEITKEELDELLLAAGKAPSAWNLQHWKFLVFHGKDVQQRLYPIAYNQQQIVDASAVIAVLGDLEAEQNLEEVFGPLVEQGFMMPEAKERLAMNVAGAYKNTQYARDAAVCNASLAAMQFMLAAKAKGWDTCPIGGYNAQAFIEEFKVPSRYLPVMLITVGKATVPGHPSSRMELDKITEWVK
ncbi:nitroreductase family protein [Ectobacillus panaciterrae]|uniref:nitroreductase family protein n=1 Tax=Ectobacillus panaciterrae TaxID=363872 RepID=UPI00040CECE6|nr:nitroreductase family protein [Ectobacillus panaciterrae]